MQNLGGGIQHINHCQTTKCYYLVKDRYNRQLKLECKSSKAQKIYDVEFYTNMLTRQSVLLINIRGVSSVTTSDGLLPQLRHISGACVFFLFSQGGNITQSRRNQADHTGPILGLYLDIYLRKIFFNDFSKHI